MRAAGCRRAAAAALCVAASLLLAASAPADERTLVLDPEASRVEFTLGATLHTVHGTLRVSRGELRFDAGSGTASGEITLDATTALTGNAARDANMRDGVLETARFPTIVFRAERLEVVSQTADTAEVRLYGVLALHGQERPLAIPARLTAKGDRLVVAARFRVPYVEWSVPDPSNFVLRVDRFVDVTLAAEGTLRSP